MNWFCRKKKPHSMGRLDIDKAVEITIRQIGNLKPTPRDALMLRLGANMQHLADVTKGKEQRLIEYDKEMEKLRQVQCHLMSVIAMQKMKWDGKYINLINQKEEK
jgi:nucleotidyltransferase/DNA polymerase involved in DNA repair